MKQKGFVGDALATVFGILIIVIAVLSLSTTIGNSSQAIVTGANQSAPAQQLAPLIPFLWVIIALAAVLGGVMYFFGKQAN